MGLRRIGRGFLTALTWGLLWAPLGVTTGMMVDPHGTMDEPWVAVGAYPGFLCGLVFSAVLGIIERRRRLEELSLPVVATCGALSGLVVIVLPFSGLLGTTNAEHPFSRWRLAVIGAVTLLSAITAVGSVLLSRSGVRRPAGTHR